jgi:hypothetical protein
VGAEDGGCKTLFAVLFAVLFVEVCHVPLVLFGGVGSAVFAGFLVDGVLVF